MVPSSLTTMRIPHERNRQPTWHIQLGRPQRRRAVNRVERMFSERTGIRAVESQPRIPQNPAVTSSAVTTVMKPTAHAAEPSCAQLRKDIEEPCVMMPTTNTAEPTRAQLLKDSDDPRCVSVATDTAGPTRIFPTTESDEPNRILPTTDSDEPGETTKNPGARNL